MRDEGEITRVLGAMGPGAQGNMHQLLPLVYAELERLAHRQLYTERSDHTLQTSDLVHETYMRLGALGRIEWKNRSQFFAIAAQAMRRVLVDHAIRRKADKRGGGRRQVPLEDGMVVSEIQAEEVLALHAALSELEGINERLARIVELRYFAGLQIDETAEVLGISPATVKRDWILARAWLHRELSE
jgi:RNA polymerase sigma factor (TIGR02999 family)